MHKLIACVETCRPIWNFKMSLSERSDTVKRNLWNQIFVNFNGKNYIILIEKTNFIFMRIIKIQYSNKNVN